MTFTLNERAALRRVLVTLRDDELHAYRATLDADMRSPTASDATIRACRARLPVVDEVLRERETPP